MRPMLATAGPQPSGADWLHEVKWDGMRVLADITDSRLRLYSRTGRDITVSFPELFAITAELPDAVLDGEIVALRDGVPSFQALAERMHVRQLRVAQELAAAQPVMVFAFDLLRLYGVDLTPRPLTERRASLDRLEFGDTRWDRSPVYDDGPALLAATAEQGLEGVVAKRRRSAYQPGRRSTDWIKTAHRRHQACVVGGWRPETGSRDRIGAVLVGVPDADGALRYAGRVGSGLTASSAGQLSQALAESAQSPFADEVPAIDAAGAHWCKPEVVIEVRHLNWTGSGRLRQAVFRGIRADLDPSEVHREP